MKIKKIMKNISPLNNTQEVPAALYVIKKLLAFFLIYAVSAVAGEAVVIGGLMARGYNPLNGDMPTGYIAQLLPYYGFAIFFIVALLYCKLVEKRGIKSLGFNKKVFDYVTGAVIAILMIAVIAVVCCITGVFTFNGITSINVGYLLPMLIAFFIQSAAEEVMSRGFLLTSLNKKTSLPVAVFASATAFAIPHLMSIMESDTEFVIIGIINLYLVSIIFSLLFMLRANIYIACGLHCVWNFLLNGVMGLSVSGSNNNPDAPMSFTVNAETILSGGAYGIESSIITTVVMVIVAVILVMIYRKRCE